MKNKFLKNFSANELAVIVINGETNSDNALFTLKKILLLEKEGPSRYLVETLLKIVNESEDAEHVRNAIDLLSSIRPELLFIFGVEIKEMIKNTKNEFGGILALELLKKSYEKSKDFYMESYLEDIQKRGVLQKIRYIAFLILVEKGFFSEYKYCQVFEKS